MSHNKNLYQLFRAVVFADAAFYCLAAQAHCVTDNPGSSDNYFSLTDFIIKSIVKNKPEQRS